MPASRSSDRGLVPNHHRQSDHGRCDGPAGAIATLHLLSIPSAHYRLQAAHFRHNVTTLPIGSWRGTGTMRGRSGQHCEDVRQSAPASALPSCLPIARTALIRATVCRPARALSATASRCRRAGAFTESARPMWSAGRTYVPQDNPHYQAEGLASWYGDDFHGRMTANGEVFDLNSISAAHPTLPLPSYVRVTNLSNGRSIIVRVNDRGPYHGDRIIDVSVRTAHLLGFHTSGTAWVRVEYVGRAPIEGSDDRILAATLRQDEPAPAPGSVRLARRPASRRPQRRRPIGAIARYASATADDAGRRAAAGPSATCLCRRADRQGRHRPIPQRPRALLILARSAAIRDRRRGFASYCAREAAVSIGSAHADGPWKLFGGRSGAGLAGACRLGVARRGGRGLGRRDLCRRSRRLEHDLQEGRQLPDRGASGAAARSRQRQRAVREERRSAGRPGEPRQAHDARIRVQRDQAGPHQARRRIHDQRERLAQGRGAFARLHHVCRHPQPRESSTTSSTASSSTPPTTPASRSPRRWPATRRNSAPC